LTLDVIVRAAVIVLRLVVDDPHLLAAVVVTSLHARMTGAIETMTDVTVSGTATATVNAIETVIGLEAQTIVTGILRRIVIDTTTETGVRMIVRTPPTVMTGKVCSYTLALKMFLVADIYSSLGPTHFCS
jgi:hypothetical protein